MGESEHGLRGEQNLLDYLFVLVRWRRFIVVSTLTVTIAAVATSLVLPQTWTAQTKLLPPEEEGGARMGLSLLVGNAMPAGLRGLVGGATPSERLITLLESNRVAGGIVDEFELVSLYGVPHRDRAIEILREQIEYEMEDDGSLTIRVSADDPQLAADLTNGVARQLDCVNRQYKRQQARDLKEFLEKRIELTEEELRLSAKRLQSFQELHGLVDLEAQTSAAVDVLKGIVKELTELEVELSLLERQLNPQHEDRKLHELKVTVLREQVQKLLGEFGSGGERPWTTGIRGAARVSRSTSSGTSQVDARALRTHPRSRVTRGDHSFPRDQVRRGEIPRGPQHSHPADPRPGDPSPYPQRPTQNPDGSRSLRGERAPQRGSGVSLRVLLPVGRGKPRQARFHPQGTQRSIVPPRRRSRSSIGRICVLRICVLPE